MDTARILTVSRLSDCLCVPIKASTRLKYNSVAVSSSIVCLGTNTGSTYVFDKETFKLIKFISSKGGSIDNLEFSKDGKLLAVADSGGTVTCIEIDDEKHTIKVIKEIEDHKGAKLTCLCWDDDSARLFIGDERGIVTAVIVTPYKLPPGQFLSKSSVEIVIKGESPITQLDYSKQKLLISTTTRTLLCLTDKSKYQQVGSKPRDGKFGSCFLHFIACEFPVIYAARPGSRLWEVDFNGQVLATHQFKYLLGHPPQRVYGYKPKFLHKSDAAWDKPQSVAFHHLQQLCNRYLLTWSQNGLYILDPSLGKVSGWYDEVRDIKDIRCHDESVYILSNDGHVSEMEFLPVKNCLKTLISMKENIQAAQVAIGAQVDILSHVENFLTIDFDGILDNLKLAEDESTKRLHDSLQTLINDLQAKHDMVRSEIQDRMNRVANLDESTTPCDSGVEDNDEVRSNQSEVVSETSSRLSLSRLPQIDMDSVLRRATSAVVNKIVSSGFMKKALEEVLESDASYCTDTPTISPLQRRKFADVHPTEAASFSMMKSGESDGTTQSTKEQEMGNSEVKIQNNPSAENGEVDGNVQSKRIAHHVGKRRKKAKVVTVDFESPQKDEHFTQPAYDILEKVRIKRNLSLGTTIPYTPHSDLKRLSSLPKPVDLNAQLEQQSKPQNTTDANPIIPAIFKQAKQLVRNIMHHEAPALLDVHSRDNSALTSFDKETFSEESVSCLLVSQDAMKYIPKFVDFTAVCRNKIRDSRVLFNSKTVRKILQDWVEKLNETIEEFAKTFTDEIKRKNKKHKLTQVETDLLMLRTREEFFSSLGAAFSEVSNLASLCFETGIFPITCSNITSLDFSLIDQTDSLVSIRRRVNEILNVDDHTDGNSEIEVPQESTPTTLLFLANNFIGKNDEVDGSSDKLLSKNSVEKDKETCKDKENYSQAEKCENKKNLSDMSKNDKKEGLLNGQIESMNNTATVGSQNLELKQNLRNTNIIGSLANKSIKDRLDANSGSETSFIDAPPIDATSSSLPLNDYVDISESSRLVIDKRKTFLPQEVESVLCTSDHPITCQSCAEDLCRACFVLRYFPLLDMHKIRTVLSWKRGCRWRTWLAYLVHLEDVRSWQELKSAIKNSDYGKVARILRDASTTEPFFSCLRRLFSFSSHLVLDICTEKDVNPWEVCFIYMANSGNSDALDDFLGYISAMKRIKPSLNLHKDISVAMTTLYCGLSQSAVSNSMNFCDCGGARQGAHLLLWRWKTYIDDVIEWVLKTEDAESGIVHRVLKLCKTYGYWMGCVEVCRNKRDHKSAFELLCQLGDFQILDRYIKKDTFSITEDDLDYLLQLKCHKANSEDTVKCRPAVPDFTPTINNECIARVLVREIGVKAALKMLENFKNGECRLPRSFYLDCMRVSEKEIEQRFIAMKMMEKMNNEMCNENKTVVDKHIELMKNKELNGSCDVIEESLDDIQTANELWEPVSSNHWGVGLNLSSSNCPCCTLPLCIHGTSASAGLVVFECGHTFHKQCLPEEACLVCYYGQENFDI